MLPFYTRHVHRPDALSVHIDLIFIGIGSIQNSIRLFRTVPVALCINLVIMETNYKQIRRPVHRLARTS